MAASIKDVMPVTVAVMEEGTLKLTGETSIKMTDFGISPITLKSEFPIKMRDVVDLKFEWLVKEQHSP